MNRTIEASNDLGQLGLTDSTVPSGLQLFLFLCCGIIFPPVRRRNCVKICSLPPSLALAHAEPP